AIGSGAFPVGMMTEIVRARSVLTPYLTNQRNRDPYTFKWHCIENSLYGVDIDSSAVEIAKLRLWLSLVVDEDSYDQIRPLPNLDYRIVCGNSLLSVQKDLFNFTLYPELEKKKNQYFGTTSSKNKTVLRKEIEGIIDQLTDGKRLFDFEVYFSEVFSAKCGFDVVVSNPPYIRQELITNTKPKLLQTFGKQYLSTADLYVYFYFRGIQILSKNGSLIFISSNKWLRSTYGKKLREYISQNVFVRQIIDFGELPVFDAASTFPMIFICQKGLVNSPLFFTQVESLQEPYPNIIEIIRENGYEINQERLSNTNWQLVDKKTLKNLSTMKTASATLGSYINDKIYRGVVTGLNEAFIIDTQTRDRLISQDKRNSEILKPLIVGTNVRKWRIDKEDKWIIFARRGIDITKYPAIKEHLSRWKLKLQPKKHRADPEGRKPGSYKWYEIQDNTSYYLIFNEVKIIYPEIALEPRFTMDIDGNYALKTVFSIPVEDYFLLGVLNSSTVWDYLKTVCPVLGDPNNRGRLTLQEVYLKELPIPKAKDFEKQTIADLVKKCLEYQGNGEDIRVLEAEIEERVAGLYGVKLDEYS
ncbi:MAG: Eco57I restriction-modification methylase domain-containing protein, partial [Candidatus Hodarchaeales archaeon]